MRQRSALYPVAQTVFMVLLFAASRLRGQAVVANDSAVTVPMKLVNNRVFIPLKVTGPKGSRVVDFWVDTGGGALALSGRLALDLGLTTRKGSLNGMGDTPAQVIESPKLSLGSIDLNVSGVSVGTHLAPPSQTVFAGIEAQGFLPAAVLKNYDVVFDYLHGSFTLGRSGTLEHHGAAIPLMVQPKTGFARIDLTIDGQTYGFMLDTGAAFTGLSQTVLERLQSRYASWPHSVGAVGAANMVGKAFDVKNQLLLVPAAELGNFHLHNIAMVSRPAGVYEDYISAEMSAPIVGVLAGNVLRQFRIELDYRAETAYLSFEEEPRADLQCVGLILYIHDDGTVWVSGTARHNRKRELPAVRAGDRLIAIGGQSVTGLPLSAILTALSGHVGDVKHLKLRRAHKDFPLSAIVRQQL